MFPICWSTADAEDEICGELISRAAGVASVPPTREHVTDSIAVSVSLPINWLKSNVIVSTSTVASIGGVRSFAFAIVPTRPIAMRFLDIPRESNARCAAVTMNRDGFSRPDARRTPPTNAVIDRPKTPAMALTPARAEDDACARPE